MYHIKKDKRSTQSTQWIYEALGTLMGEKNFEDITVTEVAEKANLGRATFYRNFDFLDDVLRLKCDEAFHGLYLYLLEYYKNEISSNKGTKTIFAKPFLRYWYLKSFIIELLMKANRVDIISESFKNMFDMFFPLLEKSQGIILKQRDYFIAIKTGMAINLLIQWIKNDKNIAPDDLADLIVDQMKESFDLNLLL